LLESNRIEHGGGGFCLPPLFLIDIMKKLPWIILLILVLACEPRAADITSIGNWTENIDSIDLIAGAGSDLINLYESSTNVTVLTITNVIGSAWQLNARRSDTLWDADFSIFIKRTSDGTGPGTISGGTAYIELSTFDTQIFTGTDNRSDISVQYKLTGMSKTISPNTYITTVIVTVVE